MSDNLFDVRCLDIIVIIMYFCRTKTVRSGTNRTVTITAGAEGHEDKNPGDLAPAAGYRHACAAAGVILLVLGASGHPAHRSLQERGRGHRGRGGGDHDLPRRLR